MSTDQALWNIGALVVAIALLGLALWIPTKVTRRLMHQNRAVWGWRSAPAVPEERAGYRTGAEALEPQAEPPREVRRAAWWSFVLAQTGVLWALWSVASVVSIFWIPFEAIRSHEYGMATCVAVFGLLPLGLGWLGVTAALDRARMGSALLRAEAVEGAFAQMQRRNTPLEWILLVTCELIALGMLCMIGLEIANGATDPAGEPLVIALYAAMGIAPFVAGRLYARSVRRALATIAERTSAQAAASEARS